MALQGRPSYKASGLTARMESFSRLNRSGSDDKGQTRAKTDRKRSVSAVAASAL